LGGAEQKLTNIWAIGQMSWSPDGKWLAVSSVSSLHAESNGIFLLPVEGGEPRRITNPKAPAFDLTPSISRDGRLMAYAACAGVPTAYSCDMYVQDLDSVYAPRASPRRLTNQAISSVSGLAWSRDGKSLISDGTLGSYSLTYLWRLGIYGQRPFQRVEIAGPYAAWPAISSTGDHLVFSRFLQNDDIWRYNVGGQMESLIVSSMKDTNPQFSPDGKRIAFVSDRSGETSEIWVARADGSGLVQMTNRIGRSQGTPRWSPDGRWIAFDSQGQDGNQDIYVIDASGGRPRRITFEPSTEDVPSWSRDGKWIYFNSNRTGGTEIWRVPLAGGAQERVTANGGYTAFESADGKILFYTKSGFDSPLFARPLSGGPERQVLPWVSARAFVPVADGIYYMGRRGEDRKYPLQFFEFSNNTSRLLAEIEGAVSYGLAVSPDRQTILFSKSASSGANLMMIENFQ
jgi:Tol biopolymer transport system component